MKRTNPFNETPMKSDSCDITQDYEEQPSLATPLKAQEMSQPITHNNSTLQMNTGAMPPNQYFNAMRTSQQCGDSGAKPTLDTHFGNMVNPLMSYFVIVMSPALTQHGLHDELQYFSAPSISRFNPNITTQSQVMTPFCNNHVRNAPFINQCIVSRGSSEAATQTVKCIGTQTEEDLLLESSCMPKRKRGRKKQN